MFNETLDTLGSTMAVSDGLQAEESVTLEMTRVENLENRFFFSEVDEIRANETAEIMADVFSEDVLVHWSEMSMDEKSAKLNEYYVRAGENMGIHTKGVIIEPIPCETPGMVSFGYNSGDGYIHLNEDVLNDPTRFSQILDTATHEMRHQFQNDVVTAPHNFQDIPKDVIAVWEYELEPQNYISPDYDYQGYYEQAIERDARDFSEDVLRAYTQKLNLN